MNEKTVEQQIQDKGLTAPRVTLTDIEAEIASEYFFTAEHGAAGALMRGELFSRHTSADEGDAPLRLLTICVLILRNGCKLVGINHGPVDPAHFDAQEGRRYARENAVEQIWPLVGFRLRDALVELAKTPA